MRALLTIALLASLAVLVALVGRYNTGLVQVVTTSWRADVSLNLFLLLLALGVLFSYALVRLAVSTARLPQKVRAFRQRQRERRAKASLDAAIIALIEGRFGKARQFSEGALAQPGGSPLHALLAARAALEVRAFDEMERLLAAAERLAPNLVVPRRMIAAEAALAQDQPQEALRILGELKREVGMHTAAQRLELRALQAARRWADVGPVAAQLQKRHALEPAQAEHVRRAAQTEQLSELGHDLAGLKAFWEKLAEGDRRDPSVAAAAARSFAGLGEQGAAADILERALEHEWRSDLVHLYAQCRPPDAVRQIQKLESWLPAHSQDAVLLLSLGRLCLREKLWGKAQTYLEASLAIEGTHSAHMALGELAEILQRPEQAAAHNAAALRIAVAQLEEMGGGRRRLVL